MKKKEVMITINSIQSVDDEKEETELITTGDFERSGEKYVISYDESSATGYEGARTILTCEDESMATMTRTGKAPSNLVIESGVKHHCHYGTPFGQFMVGINATSIRNDLNDDGGELCFKYTIDVNSVYVSDNEVRITVRPQ